MALLNLSMNYAIALIQMAKWAIASAIAQFLYNDYHIDFDLILSQGLQLQNSLLRKVLGWLSPLEVVSC